MEGGAALVHARRQGARHAPVVAAGAQQAGGGDPRLGRWLRRPHALQPHEVQGRARLPGLLAGGALHPLRRARARDGRALQRHVRLRHAAPILRHLPQLHRLRRGSGARLCPLPPRRNLHRHSRLHRAGRGRADAPAHRDAALLASDAQPPHHPPRRRQRGCGGLHARARVAKDADSHRPLPPGLRQPAWLRRREGAPRRLRAPHRRGAAVRGAAAGAGGLGLGGANSPRRCAPARAAPRPPRVDAVLGALRRAADVLQAGPLPAWRSRARHGGAHRRRLVQVRAPSHRHAHLRRLGARQGRAETLRLHHRHGRHQGQGAHGLFQGPARPLPARPARPLSGRDRARAKTPQARATPQA
mmetsp:Transcript_52255/g.111755  ORF Transcript_52255/g.111755 Transcript_52255/m.111755 type:complete len:358 (+) Transcript_52255:1374-2447(+)